MLLRYRKEELYIIKQHISNILAEYNTKCKDCLSRNDLLTLFNERNKTDRVQKEDAIGLNSICTSILSMVSSLTFAKLRSKFNSTKVSK